MTKISVAAMTASLRCLRWSCEVHPFPCINKGRDRKVAEAMVVPTNAATRIPAPSTLGNLGTKPKMTSLGCGNTKKRVKKKENPMRETKMTKIFSNRL